MKIVLVCGLTAILVLISPRAYAQHFVECIEHDDCSWGRCVDGVCLSAAQRGTTVETRTVRRRPELRRDAVWYRTKMEFASIRATGGNYGLGVGLGLLTVRWAHFFWDIVRFSGGGRSGDCGDGFSYLQLGTGIGVPVHIGEEGKHEFRFSLGLLFGRATAHSIDDCVQYRQLWGAYGTSMFPREVNTPAHLVPAVVYVWHVAPYVAFELGIELSIGLHNSEGDYAPPVFNGIFGFRI